MAITLATTQHKDFTTVSTLAITVSGSNTAIIALVTGRDTLGGGTTLRFGGAAGSTFTLIAAVSNDTGAGYRGRLFWLNNPADGTTTLVVDSNTSNDNMTIHAAVFNGVAQSSTQADVLRTTASSANASDLTTITNVDLSGLAANDWMVDGSVGRHDGGPSLPDSSQTLLSRSTATNAHYSGMSYEIAGATTGHMEWKGSVGYVRGIMAAALIPASTIVAGGNNSYAIWFGHDLSYKYNPGYMMSEPIQQNGIYQPGGA